MESQVYNQKGEQVGKITLPESVFGLPWNGDMVHQVVTSMVMNSSEPWAHTKDRGEVAGGGKKPWRQKGTGRARHGSIRSPLWVGGGVTHGPNTKKNFTRKVNRKMMAKALFTVISKKFKDGEVLFVDKFVFDKPKTSEAKGVISKLGKVKGFESLINKVNNAALFAITGDDTNAEKSFRNFSNLTIEAAKNINPIDILNHKYLVFTQPVKTVEFLSAKLAKK